MTLTQVRLSEQALDLSVTTAKLNDLAVTTGKINDGAVTVGKLHDFRPSILSGLDLNVDGGFYSGIDGSIHSVGDGNDISLPDNNTSYVFIDESGTPTFNLTGFPVGSIPIARVTTLSGSITTIEDRRGWASPITNTAIIITAEVPSGTTNGINKDFVLAYMPLADSEQVYLNGLRQRKGGVDQENVGDFGPANDSEAIFGSRRLIQTFQAGITGNIVQINLGARVVSSGTGSRVSIRDNSAQPGVEIDAFDVLDADIPVGGGKFSKTGLSIPVTSGVTYQIYITKLAGAGRQDYANSGLDSYANGTEFYDSGSGFTDTTTDLLFQTLMENAGDYTITAATISFADAPLASDSIIVDYRK